MNSIDHGFPHFLWDDIITMQATLFPAPYSQMILFVARYYQTTNDNGDKFCLRFKEFCGIDENWT